MVLLKTGQAGQLFCKVFIELFLIFFSGKKNTLMMQTFKNVQVEIITKNSIQV
jgi:hypothetical protein